MQSSDIPIRFPIPFANGAGAGYVRTIPEAHVAATGTDAPASLTDGFPPETFTPLASGGIPPNGQDFNGILKQLSEWARWQAAGVPAIYDATFSTAIGGYPKGSVLQSSAIAGALWMSTAENNTTDPDGGSPANWQRIGAQTYSTDGVGNWKTVNQSGFTEMGGIFTPLRSSEGTFSMTFPFTGFTSACLGITGTIRNTAATNSGQSTIQEVSLSKTGATLYVQNHQSSIADAAGGMRWRAWGI